MTSNVFSPATAVNDMNDSDEQEPDGSYQSGIAGPLLVPLDTTMDCRVASVRGIRISDHRHRSSRTVTTNSNSNQSPPTSAFLLRPDPMLCDAMSWLFFFFLFIFGFLNGPSIAKRVDCFLIDCRRPSISAALRESDPELYRFYEIKTIKANGTRRNW